MRAACPAVSFLKKIWDRLTFKHSTVKWSFAKPDLAYWALTQVSERIQYAQPLRKV